MIIGCVDNRSALDDVVGEIARIGNFKFNEKHKRILTISNSH
jgi:hypothetical protein